MSRSVLWYPKILPRWSKPAGEGRSHVRDYIKFWNHHDLLKEKTKSLDIDADSEREKQGDDTATVENGRSWCGPIIQMIQKTVKLEPTGYYDPNL